MNKKIFEGKTILITGGTGSFGRAFAKRLLQENDCKKVIIFSRDEWKQWEMQQSNPLFNHPKIRYFLGDVRDEKRLHRAFNEVDWVIHAAALKQVPAAEYNPTEFIKTNIQGAMNVIDAAINSGVQKVIALSTDKAVNPVNMYGATKLCSDKLFVSANAYVGSKKIPILSVVRYGNVSGSRGSVIPYWQKIIKQGKDPLPITDENMTRFWITLDEAVDFVIHCLEVSWGGEIFVPKIPSFKITELAKAMAPDRPTKIVGIREGEKLHELMIGSDDSRHTVDLGKYYVIMPERSFQTPDPLRQLLMNKKCLPLPEGFAYTSGNNTEWLQGSELKRRIDEVIKCQDL